jgi:hypothetical protein
MAKFGFWAPFNINVVMQSTLPWASNSPPRWWLPRLTAARSQSFLSRILEAGVDGARLPQSRAHGSLSAAKHDGGASWRPA